MRWHWKSILEERRPEPALKTPSKALFISRHFPALFTPRPVKRFPNKLASNVPNNILRYPPFCYFTSFWTVSVIPFNNKPESSRGFTILITSFFSSFDVISVVVFPDPKIFLCIPASAADPAAVNPKGIKTLLANGLITFLLVVMLILVMGQKVYQEILLIESS